MTELHSQAGSEQLSTQGGGLPTTRYWVTSQVSWQQLSGFPSHFRLLSTTLTVLCSNQEEADVTTRKVPTAHGCHYKTCSNNQGGSRSR